MVYERIDQMVGKSNFKTVVVMVGVVIVFLFLVYKEPPFVRSLIPNLEPYPDTLFYAMPAWNFVHGQGFRMKAYGQEIRSIVPPLYGLLLVPFLGIFADVRAFWGLNLLLLLGTMILFLKLAKEMSKSVWVAGFLGFLLVTNFYFYTLPTLLMAENISLFLVMLGFYFIFYKKELCLPLVAGALIFTKLSNLPLAMVFLLIGFFKQIRKKDKRVFVLLSFVLFVLIGVYFWRTGMFVGHKNLKMGTGFAWRYFASNLKYYLSVLLGKKVSFLWFSHVWIDGVVVVLVLAGLVMGLVKKERRKIVLPGLGLVLSLVVFMSFFYAFDTRYLMPVMPLCLIFALPVFEILPAKRMFLFVFIVVAGYLLINGKAGELKRQVGLNLRHREDPWNYLALKKWEPYLNDGKDNVLATFLPPFYVSLVVGENFEYLPISPVQEFSAGQDSYFSKAVMGDLVAECNKKLDERKTIYISDYYVSNNLSQWREDYNGLVNNFELEKVSEGCLGACNLYRLERGK